MSESIEHEELVDEGLRRAAEAEMRRHLGPHPDSNRASKRAKTEGEEDAYLEVGRFDYSSVKEIATGITCFLATCDFRREKSCTREVTSLLKPYLLPAATPAPVVSNLKVSCRGLIILKLNPTAAAATDDATDDEENSALATAKMAQQTVLKIYESVPSKTLQQPQPQFVQRLIPILSTCLLEEDALKACAARAAGIAALEFQNNSHTNDKLEKASTGTSSRQLTFGIHINNRDSGGSTHSIVGTSEADASTAEAGSSLERMQIISAVATGLTSELKNKFNIEAKVNLKAPAVVVIVEVMPIMGKLYAGIAILPQKVCTLKPKLNIKALRQNTK